MIKITEIVSLRQLYAYQSRLAVPYFFATEFESWKEAFENDVDGEGRQLFQQLHAKAAYDGEKLVGFVQYGNTAFGFDDQGNLSAQVSYPVIRALYFEDGREDAGKLLLQAAMEDWGAFPKAYAFFHYFGMSCFARHGKLFERFSWIAELLHKAGFEIEHENMYYSAKLQAIPGSQVEIVAQEVTKGDQQSIDFLLDHKQVGCCEVHYVNRETAYLRWIYIHDDQQNRGIGSQCMSALKVWLHQRGMTRLDTDTAVNNVRAQHYYEKNHFVCEGITRSYFRNQ